MKQTKLSQALLELAKIKAKGPKDLSKKIDKYLYGSKVVKQRAEKVN